MKDTATHVATYVRNQTVQLKKLIRQI